MGYFAIPPERATVEQLVETAEANIRLWRNKQPERGYEYLLSIASDQLDRAGSDKSDGWKKVEKAELDAFLKAYTKPLHRDVNSIGEPPVLSFNDFSDGKAWPESMVAKVLLNTAMKGTPSYKGEPDDYYIKEQP